MKHIDIVTSALNEEDAVEILYERLDLVFKKMAKYSWKLIIFDNGSSDATWMKILKLSSKYKNVQGFRTTRTFPLDSIFSLGLQKVTGDAAIIMASDLQDPPEVIPELIEKWELGFSQILVRVNDRAGMPKLRKILTSQFYKFAEWASDGQMPRNVSDFRLLDQKVYETYNSLPERNRFLRGLFAWTGYSNTFVDIIRPERETGNSKSKYLPLIKFSLRGIFAVSNKPLSLISTFGFILSFISLISVIFFSLIWIFIGVPFAGFGTIVGLIAIVFSLLVGILGIISEYLALIYTELKNRPLGIVRDITANNSDDN